MRRYLPTPALPTPKTTFNSKNLKNLPQFLFQTLSFLLGILFLAAPTLHGQTGGASLTGRINDASGAVVQDADVAITNTATKVQLQTKSNKAGVYSFPSLNPGTYVMRVEKNGFRSEDLVDLTIYTNDNLEKNFTLQVGSVSESVTVQGGATNTSPGVSLTVDREFIESTPLNGQSLQDLIQLAPGTVSTGTGYYVIDGQRDDANIYTVDGVSANLGGAINEPSAIGAALSGTVPVQTVLGTTQSLTSIDSLQEFKIQTSGYTAEYGRSPGGQLQFTTRSGSNQIHGTLFDYFRNTAFDSNSYFNDYYGNPKTAEHQNDFGGTVGGPLTIPHLYDGKDKTFYFLSYEGLRLLLPTDEEEYNPTSAFRSAVPAGTKPFVDDVPLPNIADSEGADGCTFADPSTGQSEPCDGEFYKGYSYPNRLDSYSIRIDHNVGSNTHLFARYADTPSSEVTGLEDPYTSAINNHLWTVGLTETINNNVLGDIKFNFTHDGEFGANTEQAAYGSVPISPSQLISPSYQNPYAIGGGIFYLNNSNIFVEGIIGKSGSIVHQLDIPASITWIHERNIFKFGVDWRRISSSIIEGNYDSSVYIDALSDALSGLASSVQVETVTPGDPIFDNLSLFAQDHYKVNSRLSLDYGLRWEFNPPPGSSNGAYPATLTSTDLATATIAPIGTSPYKTYHDHFAPRFGFAWNPYPTLREGITIRGGIGIFFDTGQQAEGAAYQIVYPFTSDGPTLTEVPLPLSNSSLQPPSSKATLTMPYPLIIAQAPNLTLPYTEQWNLSLDKALNRQNTFTASYVGNNGKKLLYTALYEGVPGNSNFTELGYTYNGAASSYSALQLQDSGRIVTGLDFVGSFTWGHALDNASNDQSYAAPEYGNSDYDLRRVLNIALNYKVPSPNWNLIEHALASGWALNNRFSTQSGLPLTHLEQAEDIVANGTEEEYFPDLVPHVPIYLHGKASEVDSQPVPRNWRLNPAAFAAVPTDPTTGLPDRQGTLGRNYVREPSFIAWNTSVQREFPLYERLHLNFRVDAFNLLNHPNVYGPDTNVSSATFGTLLGSGSQTIGSSNALYAMGASRSLQFSMKVQF